VSYMFTSIYVFYYGGKAHLFEVGDTLFLVGTELSKTAYSTFLFNEDIVQIPNSVIKRA
jgi:hypothetical protein